MRCANSNTRFLPNYVERNFLPDKWLCAMLSLYISMIFFKSYLVYYHAYQDHNPVFTAYQGGASGAFINFLF